MSALLSSLRSLLLLELVRGMGLTLVHVHRPTRDRELPL